MQNLVPANIYVATCQILRTLSISLTPAAPRYSKPDWTRRGAGSQPNVRVDIDLTDSDPPLPDASQTELMSGGNQSSGKARQSLNKRSALPNRRTVLGEHAPVEVRIAAAIVIAFKMMYGHEGSFR